MLTYQDFLRAGNKENFIIELISEHKTSKQYHVAVDAENYNRQQNTTIMKYQKFLYKLTGQKIVDTISPNYKMASNYLNRFITQLNQYLLGNGATFTDENTKEKLGIELDTQLQKAGRSALIEGVSFGFWDFDKLRVFKLIEFAPLYDEENGSLRAGARFWQLDNDKPMRITFYEEDGYTEYIYKIGEEIEVIKPKTTYKQIVKYTAISGEEIYQGENYPNFPIVPFYANLERQSELVGIREQIDAYDLIKSGFANDLDGHMLYWILENAGGMDDPDIARLIERMKMLGAVISDEDAQVKMQQLDIPYESRIAYLDRLEEDLYKDFGALKVDIISSSATTATQINAAYLPLDCKTDQYEYECIEFVRNILKLQGIEDIPQFKRNKIANQSEATTMILQASNYLDDETVLKHLPFLSPDEIETILKNKEKEEAERFKLASDIQNMQQTDETDEENEEVENKDEQAE